MPRELTAQKKPPVAPPRDTLTTQARDDLRRVAREARDLAKERANNDTAQRRELARQAEPTAFADSTAKYLLERARFAREQQDNALRSYSATATQRMSAGMGVRKVGLEKLLWRGDNVSKIEWKRGVGVWVTPIGSRMVVPMADKIEGDGFVSAISVPYFPGKETLWLPNGGTVKTDINERDIIHPLARGAEAYYRYATGDSLSIKLGDGAVIKLRELRITARKADWHLFVGSFWFDEKSGQLVRAAYRLAVDVDIWSAATEENSADKLSSERVEQLRDSIARATLAHDTYATDSTRRAEARRKGNNNSDDAPLWVKATLRPAKAKLDGISIEYGLYEGRFWLPKANSATMSAEIGFMRVPFTIDEKFTYESVDGDLSLPALPITVAQAIKRDSIARANNTDISTTAVAAQDNSGSEMNVCVGDCKKMSPKMRDSVYAARALRASRQRDSALTHAKTHADTLRINARFAGTRAIQCQADSIWIRTETRYEGALRIGYKMPCDPEKLANAKELPAAYASDEKLFDTATRDELLASLDMSLQPEWGPQKPTIRTGVDLVRYNRVEGLSVGVEAKQTLGAGYTLTALGRIGHADLHANGELSVERSNGRRTDFFGIYHRLSAANPEWGSALTLGPSLPALLYTRDEGFYYRNFGIELGERRELRRGALNVRFFLEREYTAGDTSVVNTFSLGRVFGNKRFAQNIQSENSSFSGVAADWQRAYGTDPLGFQFTSTLRGEAATGSRQYALGAVEGSVTRPLRYVVGSLTGSTGYSAGAVPPQRLWYMGGLRSVRGQGARTQEGDAYWLLRSEIGTRSGFARPVAFFDIGWAGRRDLYGKSGTQRGAGVGVSFLDGLIRMDVARGIFPSTHWRTDLYLSGPI
ncbi:MAG: hypothetical protein ABJC26_02745 [Gemmatimonadaceae bacterium]